MRPDTKRIRKPYAAPGLRELNEDETRLFLESFAAHGDSGAKELFGADLHHLALKRQILSELLAIAHWDKEYLESNNHARIEATAYEHRKERCRELVELLKANHLD